MSAVALSAKLSAAYGDKVAVRTLFERPTIEQLAALLRQEGTPIRTTTLVPIQRQGSRPPLFCVHPADGMVHGYIELARLLGKEQPVYGFQSPSLDEEQPRIRTIEEMAAQYITDLREIQPTGRYFLVGWSLGAPIACEMALQLHDQGKEVALLGFIDSGLSSASMDQPITEEQLIEEERLDLLIDAERDVNISKEQMMALEPDERPAVYLEAAKAASLIPSDVTLQQFLRFRRVAAALILARLPYQPRLYPGRVWLFNTEIEGVPESRGLEKFVQGGLEVHRIPGDHRNVMKAPHVQTLAEILRKCMDEAINPIDQGNAL